MAKRIELPHVRGFVIVLATIYYYHPDHPLLIAPPFTWQWRDEGPRLLRFNKFLNWWERNFSKAPIHDVEWDWCPLSEVQGKPVIRMVPGTFAIN